MRIQPVTARTRLTLSARDAVLPPRARPSRGDLEEETDALLERIEKLQRMFYADGRFALLVVLQGRDTGGKDGVIRKVMGAIDPQGCEVTSFKVPTELELEHDFLWRVHQRVPGRGKIGIFNRSHYEDVLVARVRKLVPPAVWRARYAHINAFEKLLADSGVVILKFFLHISRDEQKARLQARLDDAEKNWKFRAGDLDDRALWTSYTAAYRDALRRCSTPHAPWYVVPADDKKVRNWVVAQVLVDALERLRLQYPKVPDAALAVKID